MNKYEKDLKKIKDKALGVKEVIDNLEFNKASLLVELDNYRESTSLAEHDLAEANKKRKKYHKLSRKISNNKSKRNIGLLISGLVEVLIILTTMFGVGFLPIVILSLVNISVEELNRAIQNYEIKSNSKILETLNLREINSTINFLSGDLFKNELYSKPLKKEIDTLNNEIAKHEKVFKVLESDYNYLCSCYEDSLKEISNSNSLVPTDGAIDEMYLNNLEMMSKKISLK